MGPEAPREWVRAWKPDLPGIDEVFHARFVDHAYPRHTHENWTVFIVDDGSIRYDLDTRSRGVGTSLVTLLPPQVVHDGRPASERGFRKRVLYVSDEVLGSHLIGRAVDEPDVLDRSLLAALRRLHVALEREDDALEAESLLGFVAERLRSHLRDAPPERSAATDDVLATRLRELLDAHLVEPFRLAEASAIVGASPAGMVRAFSRTFGIAPHQYVIGRRVELARGHLLRGQTVADTAVATGFHDQAHLTRQFRRHVGTTPASFARSHPPAPVAAGARSGSPTRRACPPSGRAAPGTG
jgi:AraC-like DNA-binding protein